ncbi:MAG: DUF6519 domain-containing protein [Polyangiales bacterium]
MGFGVRPPTGSEAAHTLTVGAGVYYVDGIRCEAQGATPLSLQGHGSGLYLVFLEVWERHVSAVEDPDLREVALLGPDTASRAQVRWNVRALQLQLSNAEEATTAAANQRIELLRRAAAGRLGMAAQAKTAAATDDPCVLPPDAQYRGRENHLYRVEIHRGISTGATADNGAPAEGARAPLFTFKWSRDNGSVVFPILPAEVPGAGNHVTGSSAATVTVRVAHLGRDARFGLSAGDIVEFVDDELSTAARDPAVLEEGAPEPGVDGYLGEVRRVDPETREVEVALFNTGTVTLAKAGLHPYIRRWDHRPVEGRPLVDGAVPVYANELAATAWIDLEDGVQVGFRRRGSPDQTEPTLRARDFWWVPARAATGDVIWPRERAGGAATTAPAVLAPHGVQRHYAPLGLASFSGTSFGSVVRTRRVFDELSRDEGGGA